MQTEKTAATAGPRTDSVPPMPPAPPFRILGPLEVRAAAPVAVTARRQQVVLALLLLNLNQLVPLDTIIEGVWGALPPTTARSQIQTAVSVLRRSLLLADLGERIRMPGPGYCIEADPGELDLCVFDDLVDHGRRAASAGDAALARSSFRAALALWRGDPLSGVSSDSIAAKSVRIAERRVEVLEECLDAELRLGLHREVLGEIRTLTVEYPLRERPAAQLMTALSRSGRPAEALAAYREVRRAFIDQLGIEPSPALQQLEVSVLNGTAGLDAQSRGPVPARVALPAPRMLPAGVLDFTDVGGLRDTLRQRLAGQPHGGTGPNPVRVAVITGCGGVGKSALAVEAAHALVPDFPDGQLYARIPAGAGSRESASEVLAQFLLALGFSAAAVPASLEERAALYRSAIAERRLLILVEDAADEAQLRWLIPGTPTCRLLITSRTRLAALPGAAVFETGVPSTGDGVELLTAMLGRDRVAAEPSETIELVELCGALPLALRAAAARLSAKPHWTLAELNRRLREPDRRLEELTHQGLDVRAAWRAGYEQLSASGRRLFARLGQLEAGSFPSWLAAPLLGIGEAAAAEVAETLVDARLIDVVSGAGATARYQLNELVRLYAREQLAATESGGERAASRERVFGAWLALADEAVNRRDGGHTVTPETPTRWRLAPPVVNALLADVADWYGQERAMLLATVRQAAETDAVQHCWNLAISVAALADGEYRFDDWRESHNHALRAARRSGDRLGEAVIMYSLGRLDLRENRGGMASARFRVAAEAFAALGESRWLERALRSAQEADRPRRPLPHLLAAPAPGRRDTVGADNRDSGHRAVTQQHRFGLASSTANGMSRAAGENSARGSTGEWQPRRGRAVPDDGRKLPLRERPARQGEMRD